MDIYLIRHTSVDVPAGYIYGYTDVPLKASFEEEAFKVRDNLTGLTFDKVWTSPLTRCVRLANYCGYTNAEQEERIKEINFGDWEMKSWEELETDTRVKPWFADWINTSTPNGESFIEQYNRVSEFLDEVREKKMELVCLFAHGGVLTCACVYAGKYPIEEAFKNIPSYGEIIRLKFDE